MFEASEYRWNDIFKSQNMSVLVEYDGEAVRVNNPNSYYLHVSSGTELKRELISEIIL